MSAIVRGRKKVDKSVLRTVGLHYETQVPSKTVLVKMKVFQRSE